MKIKIITLILCAVAFLAAQTVYEIPVGSKNNSLKFTVKNYEASPLNTLKHISFIST